MRRQLLLFALVLGPFLTLGADAQDEGAESQLARSLERNTMSPFCPGKTLYDCPSPRAAAWRADIRDWVREGASAQQIRARLQSRAPDFDLQGGHPSFGLVWLLLAAVTAGFAFFGWRLAQTRRAVRAWPTEKDADWDRLEARLDAELANVD
ncbi:MAG: cytochrome c-type biogenesis protein CcmH [Myxococcota bacterium]